MNDAPVLWRPSPELIRRSNLKRFQEWLSSQKGLDFTNYRELWEWSVEDPAVFWECCWEFFEVISETSYRSVLSGREMPFVDWFEGATLNYAEHIFRRQNSEHPALIFQSEQLPAREISWQELKQQVAKLQSYLIEQGIEKETGLQATCPIFLRR